MIVHRLIFDSLNGAGCLFVKGTGMRNMFKRITLFSWMSISDVLIHSGWTGFGSQVEPSSNCVCCVILSCQFYLFFFFLVRVSNAWLNGIAPALERKEDALYLNCGLKGAT